MIALCPNTITCECIDNPFGNFTAEGPDVDRFLAVSYVFNPPPLNQFGVLGCKSWCWSDVSQADAELCATAQATICGPVPPSNPPGLFGNVAQTCDYTCPDGSVSSYTVGANEVYEDTRAAADALAFSIACIGAESNAHCIPTPQPPAPPPAPPPPNPEADPKVWWAMEESALNPRIDSINGVRLIASFDNLNSHVTDEAGIVGLGARLSTNGTAFEENSIAALTASSGLGPLTDTGNGYTITGWIKFTAFGNSVSNLSIYSTFNSIFQFFFRKPTNVILDPGTFHVQLTNFVGPNISLVVNSSPLLGFWYFFRVWYNATSGRMGIQMFDEFNSEFIPKTTSAGAVFIPGSACTQWQISADVINNEENWGLHYVIDELNFFPRVISDEATEYLFNSASGRTWPTEVPL